ncbi:MAG: hypothetical protein QHC79_09380 [Pseudosphingobacterium sp.]|nr:hypothetical protein [Pseudosphingobacterium sp.]
MLRICQGCGGVLGRDCWNEIECIAIGNMQEQRAYYEASRVPDMENQIHMLTGHLEQAQIEIELLKQQVMSQQNNYLAQLQHLSDLGVENHRLKVALAKCVEDKRNNTGNQN